MRTTWHSSTAKNIKGHAWIYTQSRWSPRRCHSPGYHPQLFSQLPVISPQPVSALPTLSGSPWLYISLIPAAPPPASQIPSPQLFLQAAPQSFPCSLPLNAESFLKWRFQAIRGANLQILTSLIVISVPPQLLQQAALVGCVLFWRCSPSSHIQCLCTELHSFNSPCGSAACLQEFKTAALQWGLWALQEHLLGTVGKAASQPQALNSSRAQLIQRTRFLWRSALKEQRHWRKGKGCSIAKMPDMLTASQN